MSRMASVGLVPLSSPFILNIDKPLLRSLGNKQFGQPLAIGTAVREAVSQNDLVPLQEFLKATQKIGQRGWGSVPWAVAGWALRTLGVVDPARGEDTLPTGKFVVMDNLEMAAKTFDGLVASSTTKFERTWSRQQFVTDFGTELVPNQRLSDTDIGVFLTFLSREKEEIEYDGKTIRLKGSGDHTGITEEDASIASIKELITSLRHQVSILDKRIDELQETAKSAIARKNRISALAALKSKKIAESSLATRYQTLNKLEEVAAKIEQASDQVQLVKVMESSADVLGSLNKQIGGVERADSVMDKMREEMAQTDELGAILAEDAQVIDEGEVDDELEAMEAEEKNKALEKERKKEEAQEAREAAEAQKQLDELPELPKEDALREKTPTSETGIGKLTL